MSGDEPKPPPKSGEGTSPTAEGDTKSAEAKAPSDKPRAANQHQAQKQTLMINASPEELRMRIEEAKSVSRAPGAKPADAKPTDATPNDGVTGKAQTSDTKPTEAKTPEAAPKTKPTPSPVPPVTASEGAISVRYFGATDVGLVREHNEDNFIVADLAARVRGIEADTPREVSVEGLGVLLAVCDGMGGAAAGEVASQMAVDTVYDVLTSWEPTKDRDVFARRLVRAVEEAGTRIYSAAKMDRTRRGMGTTSTVAGLMDKVLFVGQVGDSRAYLRRGDSVVLITKDQSLVNQLIEAGQLTEEEAEAFEHSNIILQALGTTEDVQVDLTFIELRQGDRLMLCSDGLSGLVHPELIADVLKGTPDLVQCAKKLIDMANAGGGHDNI
ncbi:MAG: protein phosphatase 2C domain-containing protein, partial [Myxococcales bacterium]|nr:protein phosphatase 2C domain-containing protein [Myxococcales bacterium]